MSLVVGNTPGTDLAMREDKVKGYKNFANKLWNISRFILENTEDADEAAPLTEEDQALRDELLAIAKDVTVDIEAYRLYMAAEKLYHYAWHRLADELLESSKPILAGEDARVKASRQAVLRYLLDTLLRLLHPFMPFVTEEIWGSLRPEAGFLMITPWPGSKER